jgi:hypothetical protein
MWPGERNTVTVWPPSDPTELTELLDSDEATQTDHGEQFDG